ncbi:midasin-like isoform X2 [Dendronephthya gigantea]|uniref:midasin-like isoform X2 n=1 Tax=Dendronephthya gigantea TaxID=151771 RepID=UPI00106DA877|nr:midasin-like isoform X2 [Dendronephthya gigantea]
MERNQRIMDEDECSDKDETIRCLDYQNGQACVEMKSGSTIVCKFSHASLKRDYVFTHDELEMFLHQSWSFDNKQQLLKKLAEWMLEHQKGLCIAKHFCGIILEILTRTQVLVRDSEAKQSNHLKFSLTLSHLLPSYPYILSFVLKYFNEFGPFFGQRMKPEEYALVVETSYRFLRFSPVTFRGLWDWGMLCEVYYLRNEETKQFFVRAMSIVLNCNNRENMELFGSDQDMYNQKMELEMNETNAQRNDVRNDLAIEKTNVQGNIYGDSSDVRNNGKRDTEITNKIVFTEQDFGELHMITANMLIPRISKVNLCSQGLVAVPSMRRNVEALSVALVSGRGILLSGGVGSGKTSLVEHFASLTGRDKPPHLLKVQLGDQTDSKALIGSYCCSDVPGEFVWRPGILTRAVKEGRWLLLEDIDCAPMDVISVLIPLLESRVMTIPGKENIQAHSGFQLFATQRVGGVSRRSNSESSLLEHLWSTIHIEPLTKNELEEIVVVKFPNLKPLASKLVDTFSLLSSDLQLTSKPDTRNLSADKRLSTVRDFMKWCRRVNALSNAGTTLLSSQDIFQEAIDCFCATISNVEHRLIIALAIGAKLNINKVKVDFVCNIYKPDLKVAPLCFTAGRVTLNRELREEEVTEKPNFAFTRHSLTLLESLAVCVSQNEPVLLVGETGTGKTSAIQYLAALCNRSLVVINMSQQSDSTDLIGGFKPMEMKQLVAPVREDFENLFCQTFSRKQNVQFLTNVQQCFGKRKWEVLFKVMLHAQQAAVDKISKDTSNGHNLLLVWKKVGQRIQHLRQQLKYAESAQMFSFIEGALVKAIKSGHWVLLDEINLATPETLECLNGVLESQQGSVVVLERGDAEPIVRHEEFRIFACMNPANDVGKKDLPSGIRNRFTEMFVNELQDIPDLKTLVFNYLQGLSPPGPFIDGIVSFYLVIREEASQKLTDGCGNRPYYSLRTLCRALKLASRNPHGNILRSVYESFCISFLTQLDRSSHKIVESLLQEKLLVHVNARSLLNQPLRKPVLKNEKFLNFEGYWVCQGNIEPTRSSEYVFTASVKDNLKCLARIVSGRDFPVLIQGETSVGKTSLINWLAKASGNYCVRINNHEHTDIQEYLGCYTSDNSGKLVFKEGILVDAMRKGYWIILDELNLAPTDVLEALNRLLDDNRELFIPEIQETVKAHPKFMLFATQNPPGHYGGRKVLSRAFRNRFVELHFEELPSKELETILHKRCSLPLSYSKTLVNIMLELQLRRRGSTVFSGKHGYITLRDLFRWADRYSKSQDAEGTFFDWNQQLAEDGYFLLAGRCRNNQETLVVQEVIQKHMKRKIDVHCLFGHPSKEKLSFFSEKILHDLIENCPEEFGHVVFTCNMRRLAVLVARALQFNEPVLLVGETGCGKTTICQIFAAVQKRKLYAVNCHLHTETSDFLGGLRPARRGKNADQESSLRLFEWCDGSLVLAMREGGMFLADEISLADDSVLERLNSVLEPERTLILAEKGSSSDYEFQQGVDLIVAEKGFQLLATMNPGGDYGKKELSPALRNRFTEIWCPANDNPDDMIAIIEHNISPGITLKPRKDGSSGFGNAMIEFIEWFKHNNFAKRCVITIRDFLSWVKFICFTANTNNKHQILSPTQAYFHGAFLVFLDALGLGTLKNSQNTSSARDACAQFLQEQLKDYSKLVNGDCPNENVINESMETDENKSEMFTLGSFSIPRGPESSSSIRNEYALNAPTTYGNAQRVMRAMQLQRPILLEGSPGVGKTSLVSALAKASGYRLVRINLSEQTDISDLFGADLPVEGGQGCQFSWCDGPLLLALKSGSWIVLDELNLASQSVLEGLNACFDHRGEIFIPELGMSFRVQHERTKFFACQNPLNQGGGRKGLPKSFLNRFTQVYVEPLTYEDLLFITQAMYPTIERNALEKMITFNSQVHQRCVVEGLCSKHGGSWEFNLRDIFRWCDLMIKYQDASHWNPVAFVQLIYAGRMRQEICRNQVWELCSSVFGQNSAKDIGTLVHATPSNIQVGQCVFPKSKSHMQDGTFQAGPLYILHRTLKPLESLLTCLKMNWLALLVGPKSSGKSSLARLAAKLTGTKLDVMAMNSSIDTTELLGGYEQADLERQQTEIKTRVKEDIFRLCKNLLLLEDFDISLGDLKNILSLWFAFDGNNLKSNCSNNNDTMEDHASAMLENISQMSKLINEASNICQKHNFADYDFEQLKVLVTRLHKELVQSNGNSHVSGQFEWVDGQLVKALKNGHLLLIDNVNFCSPSVLDRLNGLLEPGGELSINERGVVDGDIPVVKPHPDFRLIFAMDSKHGEISRAMRNRGVEIFLMDQDSDTDDLCSMLYSSGCRSTTAVQTLVDFHNQNKQSSLLQTIHIGSLIGELCQRGIELERSLVLSVKHVNGQTPSPFQTEDELVQKKNIEKNPSASSFQKDAVRAMISWHSIPLKRVIKGARKSPNNVMTAIILFLEWCSKKDWITRVDRLKHWLHSVNGREEFTCELNMLEVCLHKLFQSEAARQTYKLYDDLETKFGDCNFDASYQPVNIRVNGPLYDYIRCKIHSDDEMSVECVSHTNRVYLLWTYFMLEAKLESCVKVVGKTYLKMPLSLSFAFAKGDVKAENLPHKGIAHIYPLMSSFQECVKNFLQNSCVIINDDIAYMVWVSLKQQKQFLDMCIKSYNDDENYHILFDIHWKFFSTGPLVTICKILSDFRYEIDVFQELLSVKKCLDDICKFDDDLVSCHWKMISSFEHPATFLFEEICLLWKKIGKLFADVNQSVKITGSITQKRALQVELLNGMVSLMQLREGRVQEVKAENILGRIKENINKLTQNHESNETMDQSSSDVLTQLAEISIENPDNEHPENMTEVFYSEIIQDYCKTVADSAYTECINFLTPTILHQKLVDSKTNFSNPFIWNEKLKSYNDFCVKYMRKIPGNIAVIEYLIRNDPFSSDDLRNLTAMKYREGGDEPNICYSILNNKCFVKPFEALSFKPEQQSFAILKDRGQLCLIDVANKITEYNHFTTFLWLHQSYFSKLESKQLALDWKSIFLAFLHLLACLSSINERSRSNFICGHILNLSNLVEIPDEIYQNVEHCIRDFEDYYSKIAHGVIDTRVVKDCFIKLLGLIRTLANTNGVKDRPTKMERKMQVGICWVYLGMIQSTILRPVGNVDPVEETNVKIDKIKNEIVDVSSELKVRLENEELLSGAAINKFSSLQVNPSHVRNLIQYQASLKSEISEIGNEVAYRPVPSQFRKIIGILQHFSNSITSYSQTMKIIDDVSSDTESYAKRRRGIVHLQTWIKSVRKFTSQLQDFVAYQDILGPYISGLFQILQGSEMIISAVESKLKWIKYKEIIQAELNAKTYLPQEIVSCVLPFSCFGKSMSTRVARLLSEEMSRGIEALCQTNLSTITGVDWKEESGKLKSRIRMLALNILERSVCRAGFTKPNDIQNLMTVVNCYKTLWLLHEEERKLKEEEDNSLYKFKTKSYCSDEDSDEQQNQKEVDMFFTRFDEEYKDLNLKENKDSNSKTKQEFVEAHSTLDAIRENDLSEFFKIHHFLVSSLPNVSRLLSTLHDTQWKDNNAKLKEIQIAYDGYNITADVVKIADLCDEELPDNSTQNHLLASSLLQKSLFACQSGSALQEQFNMGSSNVLFHRKSEEYDIYHDSNFKEIIQVLPILKSFKSRLKQLLEEWPEHPTLVQLCQTIERIESFPVTSPVMKILNGLEILLKHSQEWESNASRHVSIRDHLDQITQKIIQWRQLELSCWSSLLLVCETRVREQANHWWFHIVHVIQQFSKPKDSGLMDFTELIKVLQQFIEGSPLGEFSERLKILVSFSNQKTVEHVQNKNSGIVRTILQNIYRYYQQFESRTDSSIHKAKAPIEKELKDFIKIVKWKDINYWAMKETSSKSHYTLLKLMKKYQRALSEGIDGILMSSGQVLSCKDPGEKNDLIFEFEISRFLSPINLRNLDLINIDKDTESLPVPQMFEKMRKLTQKKLNVLRYKMLSESVDEFTSEIVETTQSLQKLEIGDKTGKERTQFRKHIHVLKKRALADLFKGLKKLGLSYRKGIRLRQQNSLKDPMMVDCDVLGSLRNVVKLFNNNSHPSFLPLLEDGMKYYQKCVARSAVMNNVISSPSKDLTVGDVDRMKGFVEHLREMTQRQRENISTVGKSFSELSLVAAQLKTIASGQPCKLPPQRKMAEWTSRLDEILDISLETSTKLLCLLDTCPDSKIDIAMSPVPEDLSDLSKCCKQDSTYVCLRRATEAFYEDISKIKDKLYLQTMMLHPVASDKEDTAFLATWTHFECLESSFLQLNETILHLDGFAKVDASCDDAENSTNYGNLGCGKLAFRLREDIAKTCQEFSVWSRETFKETHSDTSEEHISSIRSKVKSAKEDILVSFQKWYKRKDIGIFETKESPVIVEDEDEKYFVEGLDNELMADTSILNIPERTRNMKTFINFLRQEIDEQYENHNGRFIQTLCEIMMSILPCFSQYVLLVEYHFHQLLHCHRISCKLQSVLLGMFSELLQKGFCLPPDVEETEGEGATTFEDAENCGIGEGDGMKDVSDQIEDEEQLLGAEQEKSEEKEGDKNEIPDEEHGIEMSEDFDGETHDVEKGGEDSDDEGESEDEKDNLEQQMGDVDGPEETLDEKLWADSDGEEDDNDKAEGEDERGTGADGEDESEMVAKEENLGSSKENKNKPKEENTEEEDEINELGKDENDQGNLDDDFSNDKNELKSDDLQPEDMNLADDLELDTRENDAGDDDSDLKEDNDEVEHDGEDEDGDGKDEVENASNGDAEENDIQMTDEKETEETSNQQEQEEENDQADLEKDEDNENNDWKTESETKGENVESVENEGNPDASSYGESASSERSDPTVNDESLSEGNDDGTHNSMSLQSGLDSTNNSTTCKTTDLASTETSSHRKQLNRSRANRSLGSSEETASKKPKVLDSLDDNSVDNQRQDTAFSADLFEHLRNDNEMHDTQVYDAATAEQQKQQETVNYPTETEDQDQTENMDEDWELPPENESRTAEQKVEKSERSSHFQSDKGQDSPEKNIDDNEMSTEEVEEMATTEWQDTASSVFVGRDSVFVQEQTAVIDLEKCRNELEDLLNKWRDLKDGSPEEQATALDTWHKYEQLTSAHSQQLCEQLRIVLEPSIANKLRGDYRTGKRLNMRKVIPYIASQYRKDKIWLRRTKKSKRQYQILLAIDDSSSMSDNKSKQLAFESLAVITNALTRLEVGEIAICSFGEDVQLLHPFHETFTEPSGANILRQFRFEQKKTKIAQLLDSCTNVMTSARSRIKGNDVSQLLLIVSDGRGIFLEGVETVQKAVRKAREAGIFLVFVILDNPTNKDSVLDIKVPIFRPNQLPELKSYIEQFPFPFYIVLRDTSSLPDTLSDSLRQWFELVTNIS